MQNEEYEKKYNFLLQYRETLDRLESLKRELREVSAVCYGAPATEEPTRPGGVKRSAVERTAEDMERVGEDIAKEMREIYAVRAAVKAAIDSVESEYQRDVLRYLFINGYTVATVGAMIGYSPRHVKRLRRRGIDAMVLPSELD